MQDIPCDVFNSSQPQTCDFGGRKIQATGSSGKNSSARPLICNARIATYGESCFGVDVKRSVEISLENLFLWVCVSSHRTVVPPSSWWRISTTSGWTIPISSTTLSLFQNRKTPKNSYNANLTSSVKTLWTSIWFICVRARCIYTLCKYHTQISKHHWTPPPLDHEDRHISRQWENPVAAEGFQNRWQFWRLPQFVHVPHLFVSWLLEIVPQ